MAASGDRAFRKNCFASLTLVRQFPAEDVHIALQLTSVRGVFDLGPALAIHSAHR